MCIYLLDHYGCGHVYSGGISRCAAHAKAANQARYKGCAVGENDACLEGSREDMVTPRRRLCPICRRNADDEREEAEARRKAERRKEQEQKSRAVLRPKS